MRAADLMWAFAGLVIAGYLLLAVLIALYQRRLIYTPDPRRTTPQASGLDGVEAVAILTPDGHRLEAWHVPALPGRVTVLYFHGNAGWIELRNERIAEISGHGLGILMPSYRGYGGSTGRPSESANIADAKLAFDWLRAHDVEAEDIVLFGESLGTGVATQVAAARICAGLVLDSPYTSMTDLARRNYPWLPVRLLLRDRYETHRHIRRVKVPVLVLHGEADTLVPLDMGLAVHAAVLAPKRLVTFQHTSHLDHVRSGSFRLMARWIDQLPTVRAREREKPRIGLGFERLNPYG